MDDIKSLGDKVSALEQRMLAVEALLGGKKSDTATSPSKKLAINEFIIRKRPADAVQRTLAIAYYLEKNEDMTSFNVDDLARFFQLAKEPIPENLNDKINMNIKKGHVMETNAKKEKKKAWCLTNTGEQFVEKGFKEAK